MNRPEKVGIFYSLRTQLTLGASLLLIIAITLVSYSLILHQEKTLTSELEKTVILQGRNIALSSEKALLRDDPEFDLYPLVTRILGDSERISSISIVDASGIIQGHKDLLMVGKPASPRSADYTAVSSPLLREGERLFANNNTYLFQADVLNAGQPIGAIQLGYSKQDLFTGIRTAFELTIKVAIAVLCLGLLFSLAYFGRISRPLRVMLDGVARVGQGDLLSRISMPTRNEFRILADSFNDMSQRILTVQNELVAKEKLDRELEIAAEIQQALIPSSVVPPPGYQIGHYYKSAMEVGGDYLDVIPLDDERIGFVMADVSGKGIPGLIVMAMVKILSQEFVTSGATPCEIICSLNQTLHRNIKRNMFVTMFVGILDSRRNIFNFSNAGHNPLVIFNRETGQSRFFPMEGVPLGPFASDAFDPTIKNYQIKLQPGDVILQYTDGLNESRNSDGALFGNDRILRIVNANADAGAGVIVSTLIDEELAFRGQCSQFDDITLLAIGSRVALPAPIEEPVSA